MERLVVSCSKKGASGEVTKINPPKCAVSTQTKIIVIDLFTDKCLHDGICEIRRYHLSAIMMWSSGSHVRPLRPSHCCDESVTTVH
jgi:hypothetical protein